jgi:hypothetical protein
MVLWRRLPVEVRLSFCVTCGVTDVEGTQIGHVIGRIISFVFAHRNAAASLLGFGLEHGFRSTAFGGAVGERDQTGHRQPMPVLYGGPCSRALLPARRPCGKAGCSVVLAWVSF